MFIVPSKGSIPVLCTQSVINKPGRVLALHLRIHLFSGRVNKRSQQLFEEGSLHRVVFSGITQLSLELGKPDKMERWLYINRMMVTVYSVLQEQSQRRLASHSRCFPHNPPCLCRWVCHCFAFYISFRHFSTWEYAQTTRKTMASVTYK